MPDSKDGNEDRSTDVIATIEATLLSKSIIVERIAFANELKTWLVFVSTKGVSAIEIEPLADVARKVNAELKAVIDSDKDQLCFYLLLTR